MSRGKLKEKKLAHELFVKQGKQAKEIAKLVDVSEKTLSKWVNDGNWKRERDARKNNAQNYIADLHELIGSLTEQRLELERTKLDELDANQREELQQKKIKLADEAAKWNKVLDNAKKEDNISLGIYIQVMEDIFTELSKWDRKLFMATIDFQESYLNQKRNDI